MAAVADGSTGVAGKAASKRLSLTGVMPSVVTPFKPDGSLDEQGLRRYLDHIVGLSGVTGILCCGYTGEGSALTRSERIRVVEICAQAVEGRVPLIAGIESPSTDIAVANGIDAREAGASAIQVNSPFYSLLRRGFVNDARAPVAFFRRLNDQVGIPMTIFQYPRWSGLTYPVDVLEQLATIDNVVGIKEAVDLDTYTDDYFALRGKLSLLADNNTYALLSMLLLGADGTMVGIANVGTELYVQLFDSAQRGDRAGAVDLTNQRLVPLMNVFARELGRTSSSFTARLKEALVMLGLLDHATVRGPDMPTSSAEHASIKEALIAAGLLNSGMKPLSQREEHFS